MVDKSVVAADKGMAVAQKVNSNPIKESFCRALETALTSETNAAAKRTFENLLKKINATGLTDDIVEEFYRMAEEKETLKRIWLQMTARPPPQPSLNLTTNFVTQAPQTQLILEDLRLVMSDCQQKQHFIDNRIRDLNSENDFLKKKCKDNQDDLDRLGRKNRDMQDEINAKDKQIKELKNIIEQLLKEKKILQEKVEFLEKEVQAVKEENFNMRGLYTQMEERVTNLTTELATTKAQVGLDDRNKDIMLLGQVFVDFEKKMYLAVHPTASKGLNYYVKDIEKKKYKNQSDKAAALQKWETLKSMIDWDADLADVTEPVRKTRNDLAHPAASLAERKSLLERLKNNPEISEDDYEYYEQIFDCYEKFEANNS